MLNGVPLNLKMYLQRCLYKDCEKSHTFFYVFAGRTIRNHGGGGGGEFSVHDFFIQPELLAGIFFFGLQALHVFLFDHILKSLFLYTFNAY